MTDFISNLLFVFERLNWLSLLDILLVAAIFFGMLYSLRDTQAMSLLRGMIFLFVLLALLTSLVALPAFSWLIANALPALLLAIPVVFAPEIRRALERIGRAGLLVKSGRVAHMDNEQVIQTIVSAAARLSARRHGALIVFQRLESLEGYIETGVRMEARATPELLLQTFYPNTPLHDGAAIIADGRLVAAACVMPLSSSGILNRSPERQMGLRHRAALGISEATDAVAVVVSEETGSISIAHSGRMIRRIDPERLENILLAFFRPTSAPRRSWLQRLFQRKDEDR
ncbi:MAG: Cyclic di-AMP synthase CdaA [Anaerolineales bacterium]|mgnify:FL=1|nr:Cyclic di-AMP synthase CdaA [Anaerolineales bacterium]MBW7917692.1 TIGR00159 family protein [Anaerolineales bacterium]MCZ2289586.1 diadenylate cyclase CdaA [Anaerolineales bacterium]WKZ50425.1 MAG: diadenylate cyclase CdaA [Anaerolineales bacterium]